LSGLKASKEFVVTNESSRNKFWVSGQQTAVSGETIGIYLFRNPD